MNDGGLNPLTEGLLKKDFSKDSTKNENKKIKKNKHLQSKVFNAIGSIVLGIGCVLQDFPTQYCKEKVHTFAPEIFLWLLWFW